VFGTEDVRIGSRVRFGRNVVFKGSRVRIGDGTVIGDDVVISADVFEIGDYGTIYDGCFFPGPGTLRIGHNFWLGTGSVVDAQGGTTIGDNVGVGAYSQLWTHMKFGDRMYGCRFHTARPLVVEDDAWLVGHCMVSPVRVGARSMAMLGSVVTREMEPDRCYAGVPARDVTDKFGPQFQITKVKERIEYMRSRLDEFRRRPGNEATHDEVVVVSDADEMATAPPHCTAFNVGDRTYRKRGTELEHRLMRFLLPDAKFVPAE
jgi:acetyltransferase-like isoleucine patch superfamily enzyme